MEESVLEEDDLKPKGQTPLIQYIALNGNKSAIYRYCCVESDLFESSSLFYWENSWDILTRNSGYDIKKYILALS
jgi:hypothetical protein